MTRVLSHSEVSSALDCQVKHAFRYTGALTDGTVLKPKSATVPMREGRMWGRMVAAWHQTRTLEQVVAVLNEALKDDAQMQRDAGLYIQADHDAVEEKMLALFAQYALDAEPLRLTSPELELLASIPSRTGRGNSSIYRLQTFFDGVCTDDMGRTFLVEFKLRNRLQPYELIVKDRQIRWYAWAFQQATGVAPSGVILDERLNDLPSPVKLNQDGKPSKVQSCRPDDYINAWHGLAGEPDPDVLAKLRARKWQNRTTVIFRPDEIIEAGRQLTSAGRLIHMLDVGDLFPIRNPGQMRCPGCAYREVCMTPGDRELVDALFDRDDPKRMRPTLEPPSTTERAAA